MNSNHTNWDSYLNSTLFAYNTAVHSSTGKSPYEILFGRAEYGLNDIKFATEGSKAWSNEYLKNMEIKRVNNLKQIQHNCQLAKENNKKYYDQHTKIRYKFTLGSRVWLRNHVTKSGLSRKFTPKWIGPYTEEKVVNDLNFVVKRESDGTVFTTHYNRMHPVRKEPRKDVVDVGKTQQKKTQEIIGQNDKNFTSTDFAANFVLYLYEIMSIQQNDAHGNNLYAGPECERDVTTEEEEEDDKSDRSSQANDRSILDLYRSDASILNDIYDVLGDEELMVRREVENAQNEGVRVTRSGRVVQQTRRLYIESNNSKSYF